MPLNKCRSIVVFLITTIATTVFSYHVEHFGRIINTSNKSISISYQLCDIKWTRVKIYPTICTDYQANLNPISQSGQSIEVNLDYFDSRYLDVNGYILLHELRVTEVFVDDHITRFRQTNDQLDDDPSKPLHPSCIINYATSALVLNDYNGIIFHCLIA